MSNIDLSAVVHSQACVVVRHARWYAARALAGAAVLSHRRCRLCWRKRFGERGCGPVIHPQCLIVHRDTCCAAEAISRDDHVGRAARAHRPCTGRLYFTETDTASSARNTFANDSPNLGELPGTCAHFIVAQNGDVSQIVPTSIRCDVIGHAMANQAPRFRGLEGWRNDHTDGQTKDVLEVRRRLSATR
ncbi:MAG TPA: hypothetical protein VFF32_03465 [Dermatophilaceae bacterium]|nr:hypothetical protein [Dermatophilaceae bacterium]